MGPFNTIAPLIEPTLGDLGFELVQVRMLGGSRPTLQIMAEPVDRTRTMTVEDCAEISHAVSAVLDVADPIAGAYSLEVSSPGLDRPLVKPRDYVRFEGLEARIELAQPIEGRKRFQGRLRGVEGDEVLLAVDDMVRRLPVAGIRKAKLVLNDELLRRAEEMRG